MPDRLGRKVRQEMNARNERVCLRDELHAGRHIDQRRIVANANRDVRPLRAAVLEEALDQGALTENAIHECDGPTAVAHAKGASGGRENAWMPLFENWIWPE